MGIPNYPDYFLGGLKAISRSTLGQDAEAKRAAPVDSPFTGIASSGYSGEQRPAARFVWRVAQVRFPGLTLECLRRMVVAHSLKESLVLQNWVV